MPLQALRTPMAKDSIENRRARGEVSCAECRRHKLKCNKSIPCSSCVRKGCQAICPNGVLSPIHGTRQTASNASAHDARISDLSKRIRQLEDALQISHSTVSAAPHPLLAEDLLQIKNGTEPLPTQKSDTSSADTELVDSFGTLAVTRTGTESYLRGLGQDFIASHLGTPEHPPSSDVSSKLPPSVSYLSRTFPFTPLYLPAHEIQAYIEEKLPSYARASALVEAYLENLSWFFRPVDREQIMGELLPVVYKRRHQSPASINDVNSSQSVDLDIYPPTDPHVLALMFAVFATGAVADLTLPPWNDEGELYYQLARTALSLKPVFEGAGLHAVQAIALIGSYNLFSCRKNDLEGTWKIMSFSLSLAASIGLNRDPAHFKLPPEIVQRRRRVFWELFSLDVWKSLCTGRPSTFTPPVVDCELPEDTDVIQTDGKHVVNSIWLIRYRYTKYIMMDVITKLGPIRAVKYSEILALDQKIREYNPQGIFGSGGREPDSEMHDIGIQDFIRRAQLRLFKDISIILLHRSFFARALVEDPINPVRTQFGPSFLSAYRSAASLLRLVREHFDLNERFVMRCWPVWGHSLHAAVVLGSIAACGASSALAPQAYIHFHAALEMFSKFRMHPTVDAELPTLMRLRDQALEALAKHGNTVRMHPPLSNVPRGEAGQEFSPLASLGHMVKKSFDGEFGTAPLTVRSQAENSTASEAQPMRGYSSPTQIAMPFTVMPRPYPGPLPQPSVAERGTYYEQEDTRYSYYHPWSPASGSDSASSPRQSGFADGSLQQSPRQQKETTMASHAGDPRTGSYDNPSPMQVDQNPYPSEGRSNMAFYHTQAVNFASPSNNPGALNTYSTFSGLSTGNTTPTLGLASSERPNLIHVHPTQSQSPSVTQLSYTVDPLAYGTPSRLSPGTFFTSDFDVSFDMRASMGQENVLQMLPQDMEAWRSIFQDSRFFGLLDETTASDKGTPNLT